MTSAWVSVYLKKDGVMITTNLTAVAMTKSGGQIVVIGLIGAMNRTTSVAGEMMTIVK